MYECCGTEAGRRTHDRSRPYSSGGAGGWDADAGHIGRRGISRWPPHAPTPPPHIHHAHEEVFYVLEGELEFLAGTETVRAGAGTFVMVPIGALHTFSNPTDRPARFLNTFTPPRYIHYFEEMSKLFQAGLFPVRHIYGIDGSL